MTPSTDPQLATSASSRPSDRPPLGRFFMLFCAMLALALGLAALSDAGAAAGVDPSSIDEPRAEAAPHAPGR
jgi:hypothetical protein